MMYSSVFVIQFVFLFTCVNGQALDFSFTNVVEPGDPADPIPNQDSGNIGKYFYTKVGADITGITATYDVQGTPEEEVMVTWYHNGVRIEFDANPSGNIPSFANFFSTRQSLNIFGDSNEVFSDTDTGTRRTSVLYIPNVDAIHAGNYTVQVSSGSTSTSATSFVILGNPPVLIETPPDIRDPSGPNETPLDLFTDNGLDSCDRTFVYYATFRGDPKPTVTCSDTRSSGRLEPQPNSNPLNTSVKYTLGPFTAGLQTIVTCVGRNSQGSATGSRTISTFGTGPRLPAISPVTPDPCSTASDTPLVAENARACGILNSGQITITHTLDVDGTPAAAIRWFHRNNNNVVREVSSEGRYTISRSGLRQTLQIQTPTQEDEGEYYITAENCAETISSDDRTTLVNLYMSPDILTSTDPPTPDPGSCQSDSSYDVIYVRNIDQFDARLNVPVCVICPANGNPVPSLTWSRDNAAIQSTANFLDTTGLVLSNQQNCFTCTATNFVGVDNEQVCIQAAPNLEYRVSSQGCTKTCGRGVIDYVFRCIEFGENNVETEVDESRCIQQGIPRPTVPPTTVCNAVPCPPQFLIGAWSPCSSSCEAGTRTRSVRCRQIDSDGIQREVAVSVCTAAGLTAPNSTDQCNVINRVRRTGNLNPCPVPENFEWETSPWSACTQTCHLGRRTRTVRCREKPREPGQEGRVYSDETCIDLGLNKPLRMDVCGSGPCNNYGIWLCGSWAQCSASCGEGIQIRSVNCYDPLTKSENDNCISYYRPIPFQRCSPGPCLLTPQCRDVPYLQCPLLLDAPLFCNDDRYKLVCCKTCEIVMLRTTTTPTTPTTTPTTTTTTPTTPTIPATTAAATTNELPSPPQ